MIGLTFIILFLISLSTGTISAKSIKLELCTNNNCYNHNDYPAINYNDSIILKVSLINEDGGFMCWKGIQYNFNYLSDNINDYNNKGKKYVSGGFYGDNSNNLPFCFSDSNKIVNELYIPLNDYNKMESYKRLGSWSISDFSLILNGLTYYRDVSLNKEISNNLLDDQNYFNSNEIKFTVITKEPKKVWFGRVGSESLIWIIRAIVLLFSAIAGGLWIHIFTTKERKKPYLKAVIFTLISLVFAGLGFL